MDFSFESYADSAIEEYSEVISPIEKVDAYIFMTSDEFLAEKLTPMQSLVVKTFYNLWDTYGVTPEEQRLISILETKWQIKLDIHRQSIIYVLVLALGRRSTKSSLMSFIATYEIYDLITRGNPQEYYGIRERHPIHVMHVASAGDQAKDVFALSYDNIRKTPFFRKYIDFDKDSSSMLRLFSPYDLLLNEKIRQRNQKLTRGSGIQRESPLPGSLFIESITTSAASSRGKAIKTLLLSEFAHFERAKMSLNLEGAAASPNPRTDYEIWKALTPSVKDFNRGDYTDGRILCESSPKEKGGEMYHQYQIAGGAEQEGGPQTPQEGYQVIQLSTWEARPGFEEKDFENDFINDPIGASMEYGAHFVNPSGSFISEESINRVPQTAIKRVNINTGVFYFVISIDPGGKARKKEADTYAVAWGHPEKTHLEERFIEYWIDGLETFDAEIKALGGGKYTQISVDPNIVTDYVVDLVKGLGGRNYIWEIVYDQFDSGAPISMFQSLGYHAIETFFTNKYKSAMYGDYLSALNTEQLFMFGGDNQHLVERWKLEMKHLQKTTRGEYTFYSHPTSGPVQHDDLVTATANLVHRLVMRVAPTKQSIKENRKHGVGPIQQRRTAKPLAGPRLFAGGGAGGGISPVYTNRRLR